ncbi:MAG: ATP synthase F0 subunit B [Candidatus Doudnabacteria bacterium RIFCSPLOWO2_02_FULL_48_8]|uniref:ATP synthase subunit b n=1 Tax=Candidatus Doudnabacteria bacterium RIFCSPHIGHO2_01_FULL_46_24 TaxID=1817825 RepID=A0A1F5NUQ6_9BACT|nr:MAG: ATP synthase F0 subunit B [Candidatus Doudnabacteria bacterium RIFCSPHIGHO2_01_FULL_46_24]OGE95109.1 MAG: ATP synthase F0 subunit B [Candidatus Doudnabacteria bacterium RIFCSPLOWO2_02_FULL_48_8]OGE95450.1 MAG: ATP synthase F0 subunit B [Candidatus Doudnabacteria bacterium RIFCSPHIGHO2_12_FULL_48_11]
MDLQSLILAAIEAVQEVAQHEASEGVLGTLGINWKLFLAQLINFGIVLFIFWKWIVKPLGKTLTERQNRIEAGLKNADLMDMEKKKFDEWRQAEMKKTRTEADQIIRTASDSATKVKQETIVEAHKQADLLVSQAHAAIAADKEKMVSEAKQELATLVVAASEKILRGKLDSRKDHELISESLKVVK